MPVKQVSMVVSGIEVYLPLADLVDKDAELERLNKELKDTLSQIERLEKTAEQPLCPEGSSQCGRK